jgi:hypothetical protein
LNTDKTREGAFVASISSTYDDVIGHIVMGSDTSRIPGEDFKKVYDTSDVDHFTIRDVSADVQLYLIQKHPTQQDY